MDGQTTHQLHIPTSDSCDGSCGVIHKQRGNFQCHCWSCGTLTFQKINLILTFTKFQTSIIFKAPKASDTMQQKCIYVKISSSSSKKHSIKENIRR